MITSTGESGLSFAFNSWSTDLQRGFRCGFPAALIFLLSLGISGKALSKVNSDGDAKGPYAIVFMGNSAMSQAELRRAASAELDAFERQEQKRADVDDAAFQMEIAYRRAGFAFAEVAYDMEQVDGLTTVTFTIQEGPRVIIRNITFAGNQAIDPDTLLAFFEKERTGLLGRGELPFIRSAVDSAVDEILQHYTMEGFQDIAIDPPAFEFNTDRSLVDISIKIREGVRYLIRRIGMEGDSIGRVLEEFETLKREMQGQPYFNRRKLLVQTRMRESFGNLGYPDASVDVETVLSAESGSADLKLMVNRGPMVHIARIDIQGNERTRTGFINDRILLEQGDRYSLALQQKSFQNLYKTGIFSKVDFELQATEDPEKRILAVQLEESPSREFYVEPGWGSYEQLRLRLGFREKNLWGTGRMFSSETTLSVKAQSLGINLTDPLFLHFEILADLSAFYNHRTEPSFTREDVGMSFSLTKELGNYWSATTGYTIRKTDLSDVDGGIQETGAEKNYDFASIRAQATYDTRDDIFFPTSGRYFMAAAELVDEFLGSELNFTRFSGGARFFYKLANATVIGFRYASGLILPGREQVTLPLSERFFNGGENTVRSFKESEIGPRNEVNDPAGGYGYNVFNIELRHRLFNKFIGAVFFDCGNVSPNRTRDEREKAPYRNGSEVTADTLDEFFSGFRPAIGVGLQYLLPVGPARFDFAFNPDRDSDREEDSFVFHFSVGTAF